MMAPAPKQAAEHAAPATEPVAADAEVRPHEAFLERIPYDFARRHLVLAVEPDATATDSDAESRDATSPKVISLMVAESTDPSAAFNVGVRLAHPIRLRTADGELLAHLIDSAYASGRQSAEAQGAMGDGDQLDSASMREPIEALLERADRDLLSTSGKAPVVRLVDALIFEAIELGASDIHIHPLEEHTLVRYRVDGVLHTVREIPARLTSEITSRVKVMGRMDIAEKRLPQDGRATVSIGSREHGESRQRGRVVDLRISSLPTSYGERVVLRLLDTDRGQRLATFSSVGMPSDVQAAYLEHTSRPNGVVLLTGPTGSGKTTTLYATLREIGARVSAPSEGSQASKEAQADGESTGNATVGELNVMTVEDPIEYELSTQGAVISQSQVNTKKGVTFASGLRYILRQDPDVIMVGEIRDHETAQIAIQASLTGHLVLSTLHTNDSISAITRLRDLGVETYLIGASLSAVLAQRLVRRIHRDCGGRGCEGCLGSGYSGRCGLFELFSADEQLRSMINEGRPQRDLLDEARRRGMQSLRDHGMALVREGITTKIEVERVTTDLN